MAKKIWITWQASQRSQNLAKELSVPIIIKEIVSNPISRHLLSSFWTIYILLRLRPHTVFLQYSFLLLVVIGCYKTLTPYPVRIICDCHTKALRRSVSGQIGKIFWLIKKQSFKYVNISIISNIEMEPDIKKLTDSYCMLPDKIPDISSNISNNKNETYCVFACSYAVDEPLEDVIAAAKKLNGSIKLYCTGKIPSDLKHLSKNPYKNITFTGYLKQEAYHNLISGADCILALTNEEGCLQCAGYEALSAEVPLVLSNTTALRSYFNDAAVYVNHVPQEIEIGVRQAVNNKAHILRKMSKMKIIREQEYATALNILVTTLKQKPRGESHQQA